MKRAILAATALAASLATSPAAASTVIHVSAFATGTKTTQLCQTDPNTCFLTEAISQLFEFDTEVDFVNGAATFFVGVSANSGGRSGTVREVGNGDLAGTGFLFLSAFGGVCNFPCVRETRMSAPTFSVRQISPVSVPEPSTWLMMIAGFGIIGAGLRARSLRISALRAS